MAALEIDHVIYFLPARQDVPGFTIGPGRVHTGQGTRNVRIFFERNYLELLWIEKPEEVVQHGLDFIARCARPATACPFGCVLRGTISDAQRGLFRPYPLPDAPQFVLQLLADQPTDAPFLAVFETTDLAGAWPARRGIAGPTTHANGATSIERATFTAGATLPFELPELHFERGPARLDLQLGTAAVSLSAPGAAG